MPAGKDIPSKSDEAAKEGLIQGVSSLNENKNGTFQPFVEAGTCRYHVVKMYSCFTVSRLDEPDSMLSGR